MKKVNYIAAGISALTLAGMMLRLVRFWRLIKAKSQSQK